MAWTSRRVPFGIVIIGSNLTIHNNKLFKSKKGIFMARVPSAIPMPCNALFSVTWYQVVLVSALNFFQLLPKQKSALIISISPPKRDCSSKGVNPLVNPSTMYWKNNPTLIPSSFPRKTKGQFLKESICPSAAYDPTIAHF